MTTHLPSQRLVRRSRRESPAPAQPSLFQPAPDPRSIQGRFEAWIAAHPEVYSGFVRLAYQARDAGATKVGAKHIIEVLRWNSMISGKDDAGWAINNVYVSRLARLVAEREPGLAHLFEMRELKSA